MKLALIVQTANQIGFQICVSTAVQDGFNRLDELDNYRKLKLFAVDEVHVHLSQPSAPRKILRHFGIY